MRRSGRLLGLLARRLGAAEATGVQAAEAAATAPRYFTAAALRQPIIGGAEWLRSPGSQVVVSTHCRQPGPPKECVSGSHSGGSRAAVAAPSKLTPSKSRAAAGLEHPAAAAAACRLPARPARGARLPHVAG